MRKNKRKNMKKRVVICLVVAVLLASALAGFYLIRDKEELETTPSVELKKTVNPLTGEEIPADQKDKRPVAVMVENSKQALPQWGLSSADIVYETVVEGGITRNMALFYNADAIPKIGPVRSVREYYPPIATPFDSLFVHFGGSGTGYDAIKSCNLDDIDGITQSSAFAQDKNRISRGKEHSYYTSADLINKIVAQNQISMSRNVDNAFNFSDDGCPKTGAAFGVNFAFSSYCPAGFTYDETSQKYKKSEFGAAQTDADTNTQIAVDNVLLLYANVTTQADGVHKSIDLSGGGSGIYLNKGEYANINWVKKNDKSNIELTDENGSPITVNRGKFWICMVPNEMKGKTSLVGADSGSQS